MIWLEHYKEFADGSVSYDCIHINPVTAFPTRHQKRFKTKAESMEYFVLACRTYILWNIDEIRVTCRRTLHPFPESKLSNLTLFDSGSLVSHIHTTVSRLQFFFRDKRIEKRLNVNRDNALAGMKALKETMRKLGQMKECETNKNDAA